MDVEGGGEKKKTRRVKSTNGFRKKLFEGRVNATITITISISLFLSLFFPASNYLYLSLTHSIAQYDFVLWNQVSYYMKVQMRVKISLKKKIIRVFSSLNSILGKNLMLFRIKIKMKVECFIFPFYFIPFFFFLTELSSSHFVP